MDPVERFWSRSGGRMSAAILLLLALLREAVPIASLTSDYYNATCPGLDYIVQTTLASAFQTDSRIAASLLRLHFHDCFVNGCDGSVLLVDTATFTGEQNSRANAGSIRGFNVVNDIKSALEFHCPGIVSCADILAVVARDSVVLTGGPSWDVLLGRLDSFSASLAAANAGIPPPFGNVTSLTANFANVGLDTLDLVALSGSHTIGLARCVSVNLNGNSRLYNWSEQANTNTGSGLPDPNIDPSFLASLRALCPQGGDGTVLTSLDLQTDVVFDNYYFQNLQVFKGLLNSDEALYYQDATTQSIVNTFATDQASFFEAFATSMVKMGNIGILEYPNGEIRKNCAFPN